MWKIYYRFPRGRSYDFFDSGELFFLSSAPPSLFLILTLTSELQSIFQHSISSSPSSSLLLILNVSSVNSEVCCLWPIALRFFQVSYTSDAL